MLNRLRLTVVAWLAYASTLAFGQAVPVAQAPASAAPALAAQAAPAASDLTFDVASVRPSEQFDQAKMQAAMQAGKMPRFGAHVDGLRAEFSQMSLKDLVATAYGVKSYQVSGPDFISGQRFDIAAKMPEGSAKEDAPKMLRALLEERFKLQVRRETQEHPVLALVVGKGGPKMKESPGDAPPIDPDVPLKPGEMQMDTPDGPARMTIDRKNGGATINMGKKGIITYSMDSATMMMHMTSSKTTMAGFADTLTQMMTQMGGGNGRQVLDMTGLKGNYEASLEFSLADMIATARAQGMDIPGGGGSSPTGVAVASDPGGGGSTVFASVERLGLKLEPRKAPVEQVVVTHAEKMPTEN